MRWSGCSHLAGCLGLEPTPDLDVRVTLNLLFIGFQGDGNLGARPCSAGPNSRPNLGPRVHASGSPLTKWPHPRAPSRVPLARPQRHAAYPQPLV